MNKILIAIHEIWLETLMAAFMSKEQASKQKLFDFSDIFFRHFTWVENGLIKQNINYDYNRNTIPIKVDNLQIIIGDIIRRLNTLELSLVDCEDKALSQRIETDIKYMKFTLSQIDDEKVSSFDMGRVLDGIPLSEEATDALTLFLFEESYKEYELIMIYNYLKAHSSEQNLIRIFQILIDESFYHLKQFGQMMSDMGILGVPRIIAKELYQVENITQFLENGINEELNAKEECKKLSDAVASENATLSKFFDFINYQENYHIELMKEALSQYKKETNV
ncbi:conserved hypothetical protein [Sulfurovum sp. enrichment culture clone C5]|uniref:Uncharacterized protein n=1 Tax=Sulfurovum sp. enrichment culture clone C5 TaxID=497650 RepID=A0A0S4XMU8_9BACT|nr:conserved hypothetical protein [Sulfurovum sp. enrichment culture clone C5]